MGVLRGYPFQTVHCFKTEWVRDTISFTKRCEREGRNRTGIWPALLLRQINLGESLCLQVHAPQFKDHGSWGHPFSVDNMNQKHIFSICQLKFSPLALLVLDLGESKSVSSVALKFCSTDCRRPPKLMRSL